jgi:HAMP domain-containing protein
MHLSYRLVLSLLLAVAAVSTVFAIYQAEEDMHAMKAAVDHQAVVLAESQRRAVERTEQYAVPADRRIGYLPPHVWRHAAMSVVQALLIVGITLLIVRWSLGQPLRHMAQWLRDLRTGALAGDGKLPKEGLFGPLSNEVNWLASSLNVARAAAREEARLRNASLSVWTAESLRISVQARLNGSRLFAVSNREPYEHVQRGNSVACVVPPSGLGMRRNLDCASHRRRRPRHRR